MSVVTTLDPIGEGDPHPFRVLVVAPTYRNVRTLPAILDALSDAALPVLVVDDGCDQGTAEFLRRWLHARASDVAGAEGTGASTASIGAAAAVDGGPARGPVSRMVVTHASNRGKAAALRSGFARAAAIGFTHALTIDTDGQHDAADVAPLLRLARDRPEALVIGARPVSTRGYPAASRIGRAISNHFVWLESGARVADSQCGLRVYPLEMVARIKTSAERYGFETEVITRLAWAGVPVVETPVGCVYDVAGGRVSHFRPVRDSVQAAAIHIRLVLRSLMPWPVRKLLPRPAEGWATGTIVERLLRWVNPLIVWRQVRREHGARERFAASVAAGIFIATIPAYGMKTVLCLLVAKRLRLQPVVVLAVSSLNTPPTGPLLAALSIAAGHVLLHGALPETHRYFPFHQGVWNTLKLVAAEWVLGGFVVGALLAVLSYGLVRLIMRAVPLARAPGGTQSP